MGSTIVIPVRMLVDERLRNSLSAALEIWRTQIQMEKGSFFSRLVARVFLDLQPLDVVPKTTDVH